MMNMQKDWINYLMGLVQTMKTPSMFLIAVDHEVLTPEVPPATPEDDQTVYCFQLGREIAKSHPSTIRQAGITQIRIGMQEGKEYVMTSMLNGTTGQIMTLPYKVIRTGGKITELRDEGGFGVVAGSFLPAFYVGIRTARMSETEALRRLDQEMARLAAQFADELKKRMSKGDQ